MGLLDWLGVGVPEEPEGTNSAMNKRAWQLELESNQLSREAHGADPFDREHVQRVKNLFFHHSQQVNELKRHPGFKEFLSDTSNKRYIGRTDSRNEVTSWELGLKSALSNIDWRIDSSGNFTLGNKKTPKGLQGSSE
jgi:hypothetical protein